MRKLLFIFLLIPFVAKAQYFYTNTVYGFNNGYQLKEISTPSTNPPAGLNWVYFKTDHNLYKKNSSGTETCLTCAGSGTVTSIATTSPITGGTITTTGTIGIQDAAADGATKGAAGFSGSGFTASSGIISQETQMSITADASGLKFVNDATSPGNNKCYRTNSSGVKGWGSLKKSSIDEFDSTFLLLDDTPDSYTSQSRKIVAVNSGETALEFVSSIQDNSDNFRIGTGTAFGSLYNTVIGKGSIANGNHNTLIGIDINEANASSSQNIILGSNGTIALNANNIVSLNPIQSHLRIGGLTSVGSLNIFPTSGSYSDEGLNGQILIGYNNNITDPSTYKNGILIGNNINFSSFAGTNTMSYVAIGMNIVGSDGMQSSTIIGDAASVLNGEGNSTVVGRNAKSFLDGTYGIAGGHEVALGYNTFAGAWRATSLGSYAQALAVSTTVVGYGAYANKTHGICIGRGCYNDIASTAVLVTNADGITDNLITLYVGAQSAKWDNPAMPGVESVNFQTDLNAGNTYATITTLSGRDATSSPSLTNTKGGNIRLQGGASTGTAAGGDVSLGITLAGGSSNNTENTWTSSLTVKGADGHVYLDYNPDDDNTVTSLLSYGSGGEIVERTISSLSIPSGAALTKTDDTNVTLTFGGSPSTSLVNAASLTLGWTGQLSVSRGGTGASSLTGLVVGNGASAFTTATVNSPLSFGSGTLSIQDAVADGSTKGAASFTAADFNSSSGNISIDYDNGQAATSGQDGLLQSGDWTNFNSKVYTIQFSMSQFSPADATTYYGGGNVQSGGTTAGVNRIYIPKTGTSKACYVLFDNSGTLASTETSTCYIRVNNTTDNSISSSVTNDTRPTVFSNSGMSVSVTAGDYIEFKWVTPTFTTNPTNVRISGIISIQ